jgi:hypothetical protein
VTDGRFPDRWLNDRRFTQVSPEAQMLFVVANTWSASNRTDGDIRRDDLNVFPRWVHTDRAYELVKAGFWVEDRDGWRIVGYASTQTTAAELAAAEQARANDRDRQARKRIRDRAGHKPVTRDNRRDVTPDVPRDNTGKARQGKDRTGQDRTGQDRTGRNPATTRKKNACATAATARSSAATTAARSRRVWTPPGLATASPARLGCGSRPTERTRRYEPTAQPAPPAARPRGDPLRPLRRVHRLVLAAPAAG